MTINILHLYYDLMNLYGEIGNIKALEKSLKDQKIKVVVDNLSINDNIDFNKYDLIYIGSGTEDNKLIVLQDIIKYKNKIKNYIEDNKFFIATGNSHELFGKYIYTNTRHNALNIFPYNSEYINKRIVGDVIAESNFIDQKIIGFQNRGSIIKNNNNPMFRIIDGISDYGDREGIHYKNFFGTYLLGPILVRNEKLHKYIIENLIKSKNGNFKLKEFNFKLDIEAYNKYMQLYHKGD